MKLLPPTSFGVPGGLERRLPGTVAVRHRPEARSTIAHAAQLSPDYAYQAERFYLLGTLGIQCPLLPRRGLGWSSSLGIIIVIIVLFRIYILVLLLLPWTFCCHLSIYRTAFLLRVLLRIIMMYSIYRPCMCDAQTSYLQFSGRRISPSSTYCLLFNRTAASVGRRRVELQVKMMRNLDGNQGARWVSPKFQAWNMACEAQKISYSY